MEERLTPSNAPTGSRILARDYCYRSLKEYTVEEWSKAGRVKLCAVTADKGYWYESLDIPLLVEVLEPVKLYGTDPRITGLLMEQQSADSKIPPGSTVVMNSDGTQTIEPPRPPQPFVSAHLLLNEGHCQ